MTAQIEALHLSYCFAAAIDLPINAYSERLWHDAIKQGVTEDDVKLAVKWRIKQNAAGAKWGLMLRHLVGDEVAVGELLNQAALVRAELRGKVDPGKADVLRATMRPVAEEKPAVMAREAIKQGLDQLRKAMN